MGGTLFVSEGTTLMPSVGTVDLLAEFLSAELLPIDPELSAALINPATGYGWGMCDFRHIEPKRFQPLYLALEKYYHQKAEAGPDAMYMPAAYFSLMFVHSYLKLLVRLDPRTRRDIEPEASIRFPNQQTWARPPWFFDFLVEYLGSFLRSQDPGLFAALDASRTVHTGGSFNIANLNATEQGQIVKAFDAFFNDCHKREGKVIAASLSTSINPQVVAEVDRIFPFFLAMTR